MKTTTDPRHKKRIKQMKNLFSLSFNDTTADDPEIVDEIIKEKKAIDELIKKCAPEWPIDQINRIDLAILRLSIFELIEAKNPYKVVIDEAVELAKEYGSENSPRFINGVLGTALEELKVDQKE